MGRKLTIGENDLATTHPELAAEWDFERNAPLTPQEVMAGSGTKALWICPKGHSFTAKILHRKTGSGCPVCAGQKAFVGYNDLASTHPELADEWDFERNAPLTPQEVMAGSKKKVFWLCSEGHTYERSIYERKSGYGCLFCSGNTLITGLNDLATKKPELALEWDFERNAPLTPQEVMAGSERRVFWLCPEGHSYDARLSKRNKGSGCPVCASQKVLSGFNDLATKRPDLALEWDFERNAPLTPQEVSSGVARRVFWLCPTGHSYKATVLSRAGGTGCPYCAGQKVLSGFNDLASTHPDLASEWDFERNAPLTPQEVSAGMGKRVYWNCSEGHSYQAVLLNRKNQQSGCPKCANYGYDATQSGLFYFIANKTLMARKVGITNPERKSDRLLSYGSEWKIIKTYTNEDGLLIRDLETHILRWLRKELQLPPYLGKSEMGKAGGQSETFTMDGPSDYEVIQKIEKTLTHLAENRKSPK